jgi:flagellar protein FlaI
MSTENQETDNPEKYVELTNQYASLSSIRNEKIKDLIEIISGSTKDALTQGEILSSIYNIVEVDSHIKNTLSTVNKAVSRKPKYTLDPLIKDAMAVGILKKESELKKKKVKKAAFKVKKGSGNVVESYGDVEIIRVPTEICLRYNVKMPNLKAEDWKKIKRLKNTVIKESQFDPSTELDMNKRKKIFANEVKQIIDGGDISVEKHKIDTFIEILTRSMIGYSWLDLLLADEQLEEIMVLGEEKNVQVYHRRHGMCSTNITFEDDEEVINIIARMAREIGRKIDVLNPLLDARLRDGSRVNATIRPITPGGATLTIRKFKLDPLTIVDLINYKTFSAEFAAWLWIAIDGVGVTAASAIVSGGTGSGKTTTLNALATFIPERERVITIEDTMELQLYPHKHWIQMETRMPNVEGVGEVDMNGCLINTLRMRPDRIIVGEVRGPEAKTLFTAMNTGHDGCMGTLHANDAKETITRLTNPPMNVPMIMVPALDIIIMQNRFKHPTKGYVRRITEVAELAGMEGEKVLINWTFKYNVRKDELVETGTPSRLMQDIAEKAGITGTQMNEEIDKKKRVLQWLVDNKKRDLHEVKTIIMNFNRDPEGFLSKITPESRQYS